MKFPQLTLLISLVALILATGCRTTQEPSQSEPSQETGPMAASEGVEENGNAFEETAEWNGRVILGYAEYIQIHPENLKIQARLDSGATTSSLSAEDLTRFERDGEDWVRFKTYNPETEDYVEFERKVTRIVRIRRHEGEDTQERPVVRLEVSLAGIRQKKEFSLIDRSNFDYQALIGRNFLSDVILVDSAETFMGGEPVK